MMPGLKFKKKFRKLIWGAGLFAGLAVLCHMMLPWVINTDAVQRRIMAHAQQAFAGEVRFESITPALLPWPHVTIVQAGITEAGKFNVQFPKAVIYPKIWPLLTGRLKADHLKIVDPVVTLNRPLTVSDTPMGGHRFSGLPVQKQIAHLAAWLGTLAGRLEVDIVDGQFKLVQAGKTEVGLSRLHIQLATVDGQLHVKLDGRSDLATGVELAFSIDQRTLNGKGRILLAGLQTEAVKRLGPAPMLRRIPSMVLDAEIQVTSQALETFQARFDAKAPGVIIENGPHRLPVKDISLKGRAQWTTRQLNVTVSPLRIREPGIQLDATLKWDQATNAPDTPIQVSLKAVDLKVPPMRSALLRLFGEKAVVRRVFEIVQDGKVPSMAVTASADDWSGKQMMDSLNITGALTEGLIQLPIDLPALEAVSGNINITRGRLSAQGAAAKIGHTFAKDGALVLGLFDGTQAFSLDTRVDADLAELPAILANLLPEKTGKNFWDQFPPFTGHASGRLVLGDRLDRLATDIQAKANLKLSDSAADIMGTLHFPPDAGTTARLSLNGLIGGQTMDWLARKGAIPPEYLINAPLNISGADLKWDGSGPIIFSGILGWAGGLRASVALSHQKGGFHLKRLHVEDATSNAVISFQTGKNGRMLDAGFSGVVHKAAMDRLFVQNRILQGEVKGDFRAHLDQSAPGRSAIEGKIRIQKLNLPWKAVGGLHVLQADLEGQEHGFKIASADLTLNEQPLQLSGSGTFKPEALDLQMQLEAKALDAGQLAAVLTRDGTASKNRPSAMPAAMPVSGRLTLKIDQLTYDRYQFMPLHAAIARADGQTLVDITAAGLCGIQLPGKIRLSDSTAWMAFHPRAERWALQDTGTCLIDTRRTEKLEGTMDVEGNMVTSGKNRDDFIANLKGDVRIRIDDGRVHNAGTAGLFTNLLAFLSVNQYLKDGVPDLSQDAFQYKSVESQLVFKDGFMLIKDGLLKSNSVNIVADGRYAMAQNELDLVLLVSPLTSVDWIVEKMPILGNILQGTLIAIPVSVKGSLADPKVVPLSPSAVGSRLGTILKRTLNTPVRIIQPLLKDDAGQSVPQQ